MLANSILRWVVTVISTFLYWNLFKLAGAAEIPPDDPSEYRFVLRVIENQDEGYLTPKIAFMAFQIMYQVFPLVLSFTMIAFSMTN